MIGTNYNGKGERMADKVTYDAGSISVLEGLEAVRKRPGMYIGSVSRKGLNHLIYEIVDNAVDEHLAGACSEIMAVVFRWECMKKEFRRQDLCFLHCTQEENLTILYIRQAADCMVWVLRL